VKRIDLVYTGRSGRFIKNKVYTTTWTSLTRHGTKSPRMYLFTLNGWYNNYRVTPYEFKRYWEYADPYQAMNLVLLDLYSNDKECMRNLVYNNNPFLAMIEPNEYAGKYYPVPIIYNNPDGDKK